MEIFKRQGLPIFNSKRWKGFEKKRLMQNSSVLKSAYYLLHPLWDYREEIRVMRTAARIPPKGIYIIIKLNFTGVISSREQNKADLYALSSVLTSRLRVDAE